MKKSEKLLSFVQDKNNIKNILVFRNGLSGDTVFITSLLFRLNHTYPKANIDVTVGKNSVEGLKYFPGIRKIIPFNYDFNIKI